MTTIENSANVALVEKQAAPNAIHLETTFPVSPGRVYELLTDSAKFAAATGKRATIGDAEGAAFTIFDDFIQGRQVELVPGQRVVQAWRFSVWEPGVYSLVRLTLAREGAGTKLVLDHEAIADGNSPFYPSWLEHVAANWPVYYFEPFMNYFTNGPHGDAPRGLRSPLA